MNSSILLLLLLFCIFFTVNGFQWSQLTPATTLEPPSREYAGMEWSPAALYIFGGKATTGSLSDTWYYSFYSNTWTPLTSLQTKPSPRYGFISGRIGDYWYITHGRSEEQVYSDTWAFHFISRQWYRVNTTGEDEDIGIPVARYFAAGGTNPASTSSTLWLSMGSNKSGRKLSDTWTLDVNMSSPLEGIWRKVSEGVGLNQYNPSIPHARSEASGLSFGSGHFVLNGGCANGGQVGGPCPLEDTWLFTTFDNSWSRLTSCAPPTRFSSFVPINLLSYNIGLLFGGTQTGPNNVPQAISGSVLKADELYMLNVTSLQWTHVKLNDNNVPVLRSGAQLTPGAAGVYMFGGKDENGNLLNDIWLLERTDNNQTDILSSCSSSHFTFLHLHGIFMYLAWGVLLPSGALIGRHYKWTIKPVWLLIHLICQVTGAILTFIGFIMVFIVSSEPSFPHGVIGIILMITIIQQFLSGIIRPWGRYKKKYKMEFKNEDSFKYKWLKCWKVYHQASGHIAIALGFVQVTLGVLLVNGPVAVWIIWCVLLSLWLLVFVIHEIVHCFYYKLNNNEA